MSKLIRESSGELKITFERLLQGETVQCPIDEQIVYGQLDVNEAAIWSLLLASGYLKALGCEQMELVGQSEDPLYDLSLTNYEVTRTFYSMVRSQRKEASLEETLQAALGQIEEKQYETALIARGIAKERIHKYGFAFEGKQVLVG